MVMTEVMAGSTGVTLGPRVCIVATSLTGVLTLREIVPFCGLETDTRDVVTAMDPDRFLLGVRSVEDNAV